MLGNGRIQAQCFDGQRRLAHIRGKLRKKVWINQGISSSFHTLPFTLYLGPYHPSTKLGEQTTRNIYGTGVLETLLASPILAATMTHSLTPPLSRRHNPPLPARLPRRKRRRPPQIQRGRGALPEVVWRATDGCEDQRDRHVWA